MADRWELLAVIIAVISACISFIAMRRADNASRRSNELAEQNNTLSEIANDLQKRLVAIEEKREIERGVARFRAEFTWALMPHPGAGRSKDLILENVGAGTAHEVAILFDNVPPQDHSRVMKASWPDVIKPKGRITFWLSEAESNEPNIEGFRLTWVSEDGDSGELENSLDV
jgi:hypothetical protein